MTRDRAALALAAMAQAKAHERAVGRRLLLAERATLRGAKGAAASIIDRLTADASTTAGMNDGHHRATSLRMAVRHAMPAMATALTIAIQQGRQGAREDAANDIEALAKADADTPDATASDHAAAYIVAGSIAAAWGSMAMRAGDIAHRKGLSVPAAIRRTEALLEPRIVRAAVTETATAFNEERSIAAKSLDVRREGRATAYRSQGRALTIEDDLGPQMGKVWSALLDGRICAACEAMYGTAVRPSQEFPGGDPPRHARCRCIPVFMALWMPITEVRAAWLEAA